MASDRRQFDPRFDRAFQPGFEDQGAVASGFPMPLESPPLVSSQPRDSVAADPFGQRVPNVAEVPGDRPAADSPAPTAFVSVADLRAAMDAAAPSLEGNPWLRALWVISAVFVIGGIAANVYSQQAFASAGGAFVNFVLPSVLGSLSSWLTLSGLVSGIGAVMLHAVRWRPPTD